MFCGNCGTKLREGAAFCPNCGCPRASASEPEPVPVPAEEEKTIAEAEAEASLTEELAETVPETETAPMSSGEKEKEETPEIPTEPDEASADAGEEVSVPVPSPLPEEPAESSSETAAFEAEASEEAPSAAETPVTKEEKPSESKPVKPRSGIVLTVFACLFAAALLALFCFPWFRLAPGDGIAGDSAAEKMLSTLIGEGEYSLHETSELTSDWTSASLHALGAEKVSEVLETVSLVMNRILLPIASFFCMISVLGIAFYIASAIMRRKDAKKLGRAAFNGAILSSIAAILLPVILAIILPSDWPVGLSATMFPYITLLAAVCGRLFMLKSLYPEMSEKADDYDARHLILAPVVLFLSVAVYTELLMPYIYNMTFGANIYLASSVLSLLQPVVLPLSLVGGLFLVFFGKRVKGRTAAGILSAVTLLVGLAAMFFSVSADLQALGLPAEVMEPARQLLRVGSLTLIFQPYALYQAVFCCKKGRWWTHILIALFAVGVQFGLLVVTAGIMRSYLLVPLTTLAAHLLLTGILLLVLLPERRKKEKRVA